MNAASGPLLAAAVTNAGGIGVIGGLRQTPKILQETIDELKANLEDKNAEDVWTPNEVDAGPDHLPPTGTVSGHAPSCYAHKHLYPVQEA